VSRCELHTEGPLANQCERAAVLTVQAIAGAGLAAESHFTAAACADHAWEATARCAVAVRDLRATGHEDARVVAIVEHAGEELLGLLQSGITVGDRWPLAKPWIPS
jgi:hypothetical protein